MAKDKTERVTVAIDRALHETMTSIAGLLGKGVREAVDEAVKGWNEKHASAAGRKAKQLLATV